MKYKFYMSYWSGGYHNWETERISDFILNTYKISVGLIKKHYNEVHLITDSISKDQFKDIGFTSISTELDALNIDYKLVWSLGKLLAYKWISLKGDPFMHIDNDVFLWKPLSKELLKNGIIAQHAEEGCKTFYKTHLFFKKCPKKYLAEFHAPNYAPNVGIIGGKDVDFFLKYSTSAMNLVLDPQNKDFWINETQGMTWRKAVIAEQYYLAICAKHFNKKISFLFPDDNLGPIKCAEIGYTHLLVAKQGKYIPEKISIIKNNFF